LLYGGNNLALRKFDKVMGKVDLSTMKFTCLDNPKDVDDINYLVKNQIPKIYSRNVKRMKEQFPIIMSKATTRGDKNYDGMFFARLTKNWDPLRIKNLSHLYTRNFDTKKDQLGNNRLNGRFYNDFKTVIASVNVPNYKDKFKDAIGFWEKWEETLKEYDDKITSYKEEEKERVEKEKESKRDAEISASLD
jgi:hypothetical protein